MRDRVARVAIVASTLDLPARAIVANMLQFNGRYGCHYCEQEGTTALGNPLHRWWPYIPNPSPRSRSSILENVRKTTTSNEIVTA